MTDVKVNLVSSQKLESMSAEEKISYILREVKQGEVLVLERGLTPQEQSQLIERTMESIDTDGKKHKFIGIEMEGYRDDGRPTWLQKVLGVIRPPRMTVIGPADKLKTIHKDNDVIQTIILGK
ncbi:MAG TPA: DUF2073 domain-containing protein [Thermoplasmatales archaeon]|nr:DUF2073 domain-containing protein [Candidatus Thermoplasmatota archaeon]MDD5779083.1 DUF2073 domain-containing protein [Candidatus Thermoplasmatota archaeon]HDS59790.1 DUF2073 domain-containing protein [Thermoplasmatales archaeon]